MPTPTRTSERGASIWPFLISLLLLLMFIFLWFDKKSTNEKNEAEVTKLKGEIDKANAELGEFALYAENVTAIVGFQAPPKFPAAQGKPMTDPEAVRKAIDMAEAGSAFNKWKEASTQLTTRAFYKGGVANPPAAIEIAKIPPAFREKVTEIQAAYPGLAPSPPGDPDDSAAMDEYKAAKKAYDDKFAIYTTKVNEGLAMKEFEAVKPVLGGVSLWSLDKLGEAVKWQFLAQPAVPTLTVEEILRLPEPAFNRMKAEWTASVNSLVSQIDGLTKEKVERDTTIEKVQAELAQAQTDRTNDVTRLSKDAQDAKDALEQARVALTNAQNLLAQAGDKAKVDAAAAKTIIAALNDRVGNDKELLDAEIARDSKDGEVLDANNSQRITYIDLGSADKVFAGLKFSVWNTGAGGFRVVKGEIVVTKVIDVHYSQARISSSVAPLGRRDSISNPLFRKDRPIHLFLAGKLEKYPQQIAVARLKTMNVIIDEAASSETDYILIPRGVTAPAPGAPPADPAAPVTETEFDKLNRLARSFGASLITEQALSAYIDY